jgi:hypothetical protein
METEKYLGTYMADNSEPFWICGVKNCAVSFPHRVGMTEDHSWKHLFADDYSEPNSNRTN